MKLLLGWLEKVKPNVVVLVFVGLTLIVIALLAIVLFVPSDVPAERLSVIIHGPAK